MRYVVFTLIYFIWQFYLYDGARASVSETRNNVSIWAKGFTRSSRGNEGFTLKGRPISDIAAIQTGQWRMFFHCIRSVRVNWHQVSLSAYLFLYAQYIMHIIQQSHYLFMHSPAERSINWRTCTHLAEGKQ